MKITRFQVLDPLDWGALDQPYLVVTIDEPLTNPRHKEYEGGFELIQYGPFFEFASNSEVGRFNTLDPSHHSTRLIAIQLTINGGPAQSWFMDLKRARYELKKSQQVQDWSIRLDPYHTEQTGEAIYVPIKLHHNRCGGWWPHGEVRCSNATALTLIHVRGRPIFYCKEHLAEYNRSQFARRAAS
jgi:hypothetical protein